MRFFSSLVLLSIIGCNPDGGFTINEADPEPVIHSPEDGAVVPEGVPFDMSGHVDDDDNPYDEVAVAWFLGGERVCPEAALDESRNTACSATPVSTDGELRLEATDADGNSASAIITLIVTPSGSPTGEIRSPVPGGVYYSDQLTTFEAIVSDAEDDPTALTVAWSSSLDGALDAGATPDSSGLATGFDTLSEGEHALTLTVTDTSGKTGTDSVVVEVGPPNSAPTCAITEPPDGSEHELGVLVTLQASVDDVDVPEDWLTATWTSHLDGELGSLTPTSDGQVTLPVSDLSVGSHNITFSVRDEVGETCTDAIVVTIRDCSIPWYLDSDGDGYGDPAAGTTGCDQPTGYVGDNSDCDDAAATVHPSAAESCNGRDDDCDGATDEAGASGEATWYRDADGDGYGASATSATACTAPSGYVTDATDCDDSDAAFHPGASEPDCTDPNDYDCDGVTLYADADVDGWAACAECDDGDASVNPDATETCNGTDDDCDGVTDEDDAADAATWYADADGDGYGVSTTSTVSCMAPTGYVAAPGDCDDTDIAYHPGAPETDCTDPADYDCDGTTVYADADGDGYAACVDCDDAAAAVYPGASEVVADGTDQDCDGGDDCYTDGDGDGYGTSAAVASADLDCADAGESAYGSDCEDGDGAAHPGATELCNGADDDCDGSVDDAAADAGTWYDDRDGDGYGDLLSAAFACSQPTGFVSDATDCDDTRASANPGAAELCNGTDDDCDGATDEDSAADAPTWYLDYDGDGYGGTRFSHVSCAAPSGYVSSSSDCDDAAAGTFPSAVELIADGVDQDCDGGDSCFLDGDGDGYGTTVTIASADLDCADLGESTLSSDCDDGVAAVNPSAAERCDGADDDCDGATDEDDAVDASTWYRDADSDGYGDPLLSDVACYASSGWLCEDTDCDDGTAAVNPGVAESCNGTDDDCDGATDEDDAVDAGTWYADADGDGYGDPADSDVACEATSGYIADDSDCDDGDAGAYPGASEVIADSVDQDCSGGDACFLDGDGDGYGTTVTVASADLDCGDGGESALDSDCDDTLSGVHPGAIETCTSSDDEDCDGVADEAGADGCSDYFADVDADGYGDASASECLCTGGGGYPVADATDCDDSDAAVNPGEAEICDNGVDDDCDGGSGDCSLHGDIDLVSSDAKYIGEETDDYAGGAVASGDIDGDGVDELIIGAQGVGTYRGAVYVVSNPVSGTTDLALALSEYQGVDDREFAGSALACGDTDGDGLEDLVIGAEGDDTADSVAGAVYLVSGVGVGTISLSGADAVLFGEAYHDQAGTKVAVQDVDNDGYSDVFVGAPSADFFGKAYLVRGPISGTMSLSSSDTVFIGNSSYQEVGVAMTSGDLDGDGIGDVVVGSQWGAVFIFQGPIASGTVDVSWADAEVVGESSGDYAGQAASIGDYNSDGTDDLSVGAPYEDAGGEDAGAAYIVLGPVDGLLSLTGADAKMTGVASCDQVGYTLASGDVDGDDYDDLVVGHGTRDGLSGCGASGAYLFLGAVSGTVSLSDADAAFLEENGGDYAGAAGTTGNFDGDGIDDLLIGAMGEDSGGSMAGAAYLLYGGGF